MKKVLVTGATGFIGNYVVEELLRAGCPVIASSANPAKAEAASWYNKVAYIPFDLATFDPAINYYELFNEPALMVHLAWEGLPNYTSTFHEEINLPRHTGFLKNLIQNGLPDLTVTGTCFEYGLQEGALKEDLPARPENAYGRAKDKLREDVEEFGRGYPFIFKWIRLFYMYGKGQNPNSLLSQLDKALANGETVFNMSGGEQVRDFLPVQKAAEYIVRIALQEKLTGIINCGSGKPVTVKNFVEDYLRGKNKTIQLNLGYYPYVEYEPMRFWADVSKLNIIIKKV